MAQIEHNRRRLGERQSGGGQASEADLSLAGLLCENTDEGKQASAQEAPSQARAGRRGLRALLDTRAAHRIRLRRASGPLTPHFWAPSHETAGGLRAWRSWLRGRVACVGSAVPLKLQKWLKML